LDSLVLRPGIGKGQIVLLEIEMSLAHEQMEFRRALASLDELSRGSSSQGLLAGSMGAIESTYR